MSMKSLPDPWGSSPGKPPAFCFYIQRWRDDEERVACYALTAAQRYSGHKLLHCLLADDEIEWVHKNKLKSSSGLVVYMVEYHNDYADTPCSLKKIWEHELTLPEMAWDLEDQQVRTCLLIRAHNEPTTLDQIPQREKRERTSGPKVDAPSGSIHVKDIALSMGIDPKDARRALRAIMPKPAWGWWFKTDEVDSLKARIKEQLDD